MTDDGGVMPGPEAGQVGPAAGGPGGPSRLECPRCGYDQRGVASSWREHCPLGGTCAECGLEFDWREVLNPEYGLPPWCVEHAALGRLRARQLVGTLARCLVPWRFWKQLKLSHPSRPGRIVAYLLFLGVVLYLTVAVGTAALARIDYLRAMSRGGTTGVTMSEVLWQAAAMPLSRRSPGGVRYPGGAAGSFVLPLDPPFRHFVWGFARWVPQAAIIASVVPFIGLAFAALPIARRRARVRWRHVLRIVAYGLGLYVPVAIVATWAVVIAYRGTGSATPVLLTFVSVLFLLPATFLWWLTATRSYLRMALPWLVTISVFTIGWLMPFAAVAVIWTRGR